MDTSEIMQYTHWLLGGIVAIGGWFLNVVWNQVRELSAQNKALTDELTRSHAALTMQINDIKILVAGDYVKRDYLENIVKALFEKIDRISDKLSEKADR